MTLLGLILPVTDRRKSNEWKKNFCFKICFGTRPIQLPDQLLKDESISRCQRDKYNL